jgi:hypothetical protein
VAFAVVGDPCGVGPDVSGELLEVFGELALCFSWVFAVKVVFEPGRYLVGAEGVAVPQQPLEPLQLLGDLIPIDAPSRLLLPSGE